VRYATPRAGSACRRRAGAGTSSSPLRRRYAVGGLQLRVDHDAVIDGQSRFLRHRHLGYCADTHDEQLGIEGAVVAELDAHAGVGLGHCGDAGTAADVNAGSLVPMLNHLSDRGWHPSAEQPWRHFEHGDMCAQMACR
jgi:hypothetical protein